VRQRQPQRRAAADAAGNRQTQAKYRQSRDAWVRRATRLFAPKAYLEIGKRIEKTRDGNRAAR
jgi:hypothetical protein